MPWSRDDTKDWISQLENRIEDIDYYLQRTVEWCEHNGIWNDYDVFILSFMTALWVSHMRMEPISKLEIFEMIGIQDLELLTEDNEYELSEEFKKLDFEEFLDRVSSKF